MPRGVHLSCDIKKKIIEKYRQGLKMATISRHLNIHKSLVSKHIRLFRRRGDVHIKQKSGRRRKTNERWTNVIMRAVKQNPFITAVQIKRENPDLPISVRSIRRRLCENRFMARKPAKKPFISKKNVRERLRFARDHVDWTDVQWKNVLFSDESKFNLHRSDGMVWVRRPKGERYNPKYTIPTMKHGGGKSLMVWGCISGHGVGPLVKIEGIMDRYKYLDILRMHMIPHSEENLPLRWSFQHDNDPKHTAKAVKDFLLKEKVPVMKWPPQSPDLNPIENMWEQLDQMVRKNHPEKFNNTDELFRALTQAWKKISKEYVQKLILSMKSRCRTVIQNKGFATKY